MGANQLSGWRLRVNASILKNALTISDECHLSDSYFPTRLRRYMTCRSSRGLLTPIEIAAVSRRTRAKIRRWRRATSTAVFSSVGFLALVFCSTQATIGAGIIEVASREMPLPAGQNSKGPSIPEGLTTTTAKITWISLDPDGKPRRTDNEIADAPRLFPVTPHNSVCVRLCDGYYFPIGPLLRAGDLAKHEAACSGLCPDAPTQLFLEPAGSGRIEDAVSSDGARYTALPAAFRHRATVDNACTCHRGGRPGVSLRDDFTLRQGDSIMTPKGIIVFRSGAGSPHGPSDFVTLADASMPSDKRELLAEIERSSLPNIDPSDAKLLPRLDPQIAFETPPDDRPSVKSANNSIHFVEPIGSANN
jgi:Protein of unknown function (DUF2865)